MIKVKEFKGTITEPDIQDKLEKFIKELSVDDIVDIKFNTNMVNIKKADGSTDIISLSSVLLIYEN